MTTPAQFAEIYNDIETYPRISDVADKLGINERTVRKKVAMLRAHETGPVIVSRQREAEKGRLGFDPVLPGFAVKSIASKDESGAWVKQVKEPGEFFAMPAGQRLKGVSALLDAEGRKLAEWVKTKEDDVTGDLIAGLLETFKDYKGAARLQEPPKRTNDEILTVYPIADLHYGMYANERETGQAYNRQIARDRALDMAQRLIAGSRPSKRAIVLGLGDLFHNNDSKNMTPRSGHILDVDGTWPQILAGGVRLVIDLIELALQKHEQVLVRMLPGNHDPEGAIALTVALSVFYDGNKRVVVDDDPGLHWFLRFGKVLLGATHGHTMKPDRMAMMMATDRAEDWGVTLFKHFFFGHIHHETAKEVGPVRCESFSTIAGKDSHAHGGGYRSGQALNALTFHRDRGEIGRHREAFLI